MQNVKKLYALVFLLVLTLLCWTNIKVFLLNWNSDADTIEAALSEGFIFRENVIVAHSYIERMITPNILYKDGEMMVRRPDGRIVAPQEDCNIEEQLQGMENLSQLCSQNGIDLLYVNCPAQCGTDKELLDLGVYSFCSSRSEKFLAGLETKGIHLLNLDEFFDCCVSENLFYYTDHHWTTHTGLMAARKIMSYSNEMFNLHFDLEPLDDSNLKYTVYENSWLGESGRYVGYGWAGRLDDYTLIEPVKDVQLTYDIPRTDSHLEGGFDILLDKSRLEKQVNGENSLQKSYSLHYTYLPNADFVTLKNAGKKDGPKVLLIKDSFALSMAPFMLLGANEIVMWDMRYNDMNFEEYINEFGHEFDIVIVSYTEGSSIAKPLMFEFCR